MRTFTSRCLPLVLAAAAFGCGPSMNATGDGGDTGGTADTMTSGTASDGPTDGSGAPTDGESGAGSGDATGTGAGDPTGAETGDESATEGEDPIDTTGSAPGEVPEGPALHCDGAAWVTTVAPGMLHGLALDTKGHTIGFGEYYFDADPDPGQALVFDLDPAGTVVRLDRSGSQTQRDLALAGGVDASGNVYALFSEKMDTVYWLRKFDPAGALLTELQLDAKGREPYDLAVGPEGSLVVTAKPMALFGDNALTRFTPELEVVWTQASDLLHVHAVNAAGLAIATRWSDGLALLDADGGTVWSIDWKLFNEGHADINEAGQIVVGGQIEGGQLSVARFDPDGSPVWDRHFTVLDQFDVIEDTAIDEVGTIAVAGDVDPSSSFALKFTANGELVEQHLCAHASGSSHHVTLDAAGGLRLSGSFAESSRTWAYVAAYE